MSRRAIPIPQSLVRRILIGGGEREPMAVVCGLGFGFVALGWNMHSLFAFGIGVIILVLGTWALRRAAAEDPIMFSVFRRYLGYKPTYAARRPFSKKG